ncbi:hypothetical protein HDU89_000055 [Geranomyces variabilis]|nr:hypothetical protein HDU89_000055 [Geranomyces variabilis]
MLADKSKEEVGSSTLGHWLTVTDIGQRALDRLCEITRKKAATFRLVYLGGLINRDMPHGFKVPNTDRSQSQHCTSSPVATPLASCHGTMVVVHGLLRCCLCACGYRKYKYWNRDMVAVLNMNLKL